MAYLAPILEQRLKGNDRCGEQTLVRFTNIVQHIIPCKGKVSQLHAQRFCLLCLEVKELTALVCHLVKNRHYVGVRHGFLRHSIKDIASCYDASLELREIVSQRLDDRQTSVGKVTCITCRKNGLCANLTQVVCKTFHWYAQRCGNVSQTTCRIHNLVGFEIICRQLLCGSTQIHQREWRLKSHRVQFLEDLATTFKRTNKNAKRTFQKLVLRTDFVHLLYERRSRAQRQGIDDTVTDITERLRQIVV